MLPTSDPRHCPRGDEQTKGEGQKRRQMLAGERATRGWAVILLIAVYALLCSQGNAAGCHPTQVKFQGTTNPKDCPCLSAVPCSLAAFKILSKSSSCKSVNVNDKEKQSHRAVRPHRVINVDVSFLPACCQVSSLPAGRAPSTRDGLAVMR